MMKHVNIRLTAISTICLGLAACGDDVARQQDVPAADAETAREALILAESLFDRRDTREDKMQCVEGGSLEGVTLETERARLSNREDAQHTFTNCVTDGVVLNGELTWDAADDNRIRRTGLINFAGKVQGACELEETYTLESSLLGGKKLKLQQSKFCGRDVTTLWTQSLRDKADKLASTVADKGHHAADKIKDSAHSARQQAGEAADDAGDRANELADKAGDKASDTVEGTKEAAGNIADKAKQSTEAVREKTAEVVGYSRDLTASSADGLKESAQAARERAGDWAGRAYDKAGEVKDSVRAAAGNAYNKVREAVGGRSDAADAAKDSASNAKDQASDAAGQAADGAQGLVDDATN